VSQEGQLIFYYQAKVQGQIAIIRPRELTRRVLQGTGLVHCNGRTCGTELLCPSKVVIKGWDVAADDLRNDKTSSKCRFMKQIWDVAWQLRQRGRIPTYEGGNAYRVAQKLFYLVTPGLVNMQQSFDAEL
jgi:hypothetical protein